MGARPMSPRTYPKKPIPDRFWSKVKKTPFCWLFQGCTTRDGYGQFLVTKGKAQFAHRFAWELTFGPIPPGQSIFHQCPNKACVRPEHLLMDVYTATWKRRKKLQEEQTS